MLQSQLENVTKLMLNLSVTVGQLQREVCAHTSISFIYLYLSPSVPCLSGSNRLDVTPCVVGVRQAELLGGVSGVVSGSGPAVVCAVLLQLLQ